METATPVKQPTTEPIPNRTPPEANQLMKFHACLNVSDLGRSLEFYSALLGCAPVKSYGDYAKFEIDVPPLILSLKPKRACVGGPLNHLGLRVTSPEQLNAIYGRMKAVGARIGRQDDVACCYAWQTKLWITDPDETLWEVYQFHDDAPDWGEKQNLVKLWKAPLQAFGIKGVVKRLWANKFFKRGAVEHLEMGQQGENTTEFIPGNGSCQVRGEEQR
jgi:catechol 2,3-dioxygenase-like lactoylglutathione lyase family enzyme